MTLWEVSQELSRRLVSLFTRRADGTRPVYGGAQIFQQDANWRDCILFFEYFHGDNGAGIGASHQTGWTGLVAKLIQQTTEYANKPPGPKFSLAASQAASPAAKGKETGANA